MFSNLVRGVLTRVGAMIGSSRAVPVSIPQYSKPQDVQQPVAMTEAPVLDLPYRSGVGIMLINRHGLVWVGRRQPKWAARDMPPFWQMPQGGISMGEQPEDAALRELQEETGIVDVEIIGAMSDWLTYDLPPHLVGTAMKGRYRGQRQRWFAMRFNGPDSAVSIQPARRRKAEFDAWQWVTIDELPDLVVSFKRPMYETICRQFRHLVQS